MPRKQRFKPSRKPKPMPETQAQEGAELERARAQLAEAPRTPASESREPAPDTRPPFRDPREEIGAR